VLFRSPVIYRCHLCGERGISSILEHISSVHRFSLLDMINQSTCLICKYKMDSPALLYLHLLYHHSDLFPDRSVLKASIDSIKLLNDSRNPAPNVATPPNDNMLLTISHEITPSKNVAFSSSSSATPVLVVAKSEAKVEKIMYQFKCTPPCRKKFLTTQELKLHQENSHPFRFVVQFLSSNASNPPGGLGQIDLSCVDVP